MAYGSLKNYTARLGLQLSGTMQGHFAPHLLSQTVHKNALALVLHILPRIPLCIALKYERNVGKFQHILAGYSNGLPKSVRKR